MKTTIHTLMQDYGHMVDRIIVESDAPIPAVKPEDFKLTNCYWDLSAKKATFATCADLKVGDILLVHKGSGDVLEFFAFRP